MIRQYELVERVKAYDPSADEDVLNAVALNGDKAVQAVKLARGGK